MVLNVLFFVKYVKPGGMGYYKLIICRWVTGLDFGIYGLNFGLSPPKSSTRVKKKAEPVVAGSASSIY